jgi:hypothetical protein
MRGVPHCLCTANPRNAMQRLPASHTMRHTPHLDCQGIPVHLCILLHLLHQSQHAQPPLLRPPGSAGAPAATPLLILGAKAPCAALPPRTLRRCPLQIRLCRQQQQQRRARVEHRAEGEEKRRSTLPLNQRHRYAEAQTCPRAHIAQTRRCIGRQEEQQADQQAGRGCLAPESEPEEESRQPRLRPLQAVGQVSTGADSPVRLADIACSAVGVADSLQQSK